MTDLTAGAPQSDVATYDSFWADDFERGPEAWLEDLINAQAGRGPYAGMRPTGAALGALALSRLAADLSRAKAIPDPPHAILSERPESSALRYRNGGYTSPTHDILARLGYAVHINEHGRDGLPYATFYLMSEDDCNA